MLTHVDRFHAAVSVLAGNGKVKQRLMTAYENHLADIDDDKLPRALRQEFVDLKSLMNRVAPLNGEGPICASVRKMSRQEAGECAVSVVSMYREVMRHSDEIQAVAPLDRKGLRAVPPFLVKSN